jgi:hypothetical protein
MPIHPLCGETFDVIRWVKFPDGRRYVEVQSQTDEVIRLPLSFTDRVPCLVPPRDGQRTVCFTASGLQRLASAIEATMGDHQNGKKVDVSKKVPSCGVTEQVTRDARNISSQRFSRKSTTAGTGPSCRASRSAGRAGSPDSDQRKPKQGGKEL